jgi:hypothetical protein
MSVTFYLEMPKYIAIFEDGDVIIEDAIVKTFFKKIFKKLNIECESVMLCGIDGKKKKFNTDEYLELFSMYDDFIKDHPEVKIFKTQTSDCSREDIQHMLSLPLVDLYMKRKISLRHTAGTLVLIPIGDIDIVSAKMSLTKKSIDWDK